MHEVTLGGQVFRNAFAKIDKVVYMFTSRIFDILAHGHLEKAAYNIDGFSVTEGCPGSKYLDY